MANSKQRLFEVMGKVDSSFKPRLNEFYNPQPEGTELNPQEVLNSYLETALWAEGGDGNELDGKTIYDVDDRAKQASIKDIQTFIQQAQQQAPEELANYDAKSLGHNLWLSRNGHGAGFFDDNNDTLQNIARAMKGADIYVGDDGKVYIMGTESGMNEVGVIQPQPQPVQAAQPAVQAAQQPQQAATGALFGGTIQKGSGKIDIIKPTIGNDTFTKVTIYNNGEVLAYDVNNRPDNTIHKLDDLINANRRISREDSDALNNILTTDFGLDRKEFYISENTMNEMPNWGKTRANPAYTHFAVLKTTGKIVNGWDYKGYDQAELREDKKYYFLNDIKDNQIDPKAVIILTKKYLLAHGTNPSDYANWHKNDTDGTDIYTM